MKIYKGIKGIGLAKAMKLLKADVKNLRPLIVNTKLNY